MYSINQAVKEATNECTDFSTSFDNLISASVELKNLTCGYHKSYWGDERDQGIHPLTTKTLEYHLISVGVEDVDLIQALVKSFKETMGIELLNARIVRPQQTILMKDGKIKSTTGTTLLIIEASDDPRILEKDYKLIS